MSEARRSELTEREAAVLRYLATHAGRPVSREELLREVWRLDPARTATRTVDVHMAKLRAKLRGRAGGPQVMRTVRGCGYMLATSRAVSDSSNMIQQGQKQGRP